MKVIMLVDVKKVGQKGRVVEVKDGYAQNVLIPRRMAIPATPEAMRKAEQAALGAKERAAMDDALAQNPANTGAFMARPRELPRGASVNCASTSGWWWRKNGSSGRTRTCNLAVNSRLLHH